MAESDEPRTLAQPSAAFLGDRGDPDPTVRALIADAGSDLPTSYLRAVVALCGARLLLPVVATGDDSSDGPDPDRQAELATVSIKAPDGRRALLAFTGIDAVVAWEPRARPVPATLDDVAATVLETGDDALLVDPAGPVPFVIGDDLIAQLAQGRRLVELDDGGFGWAFLNQDT
ncbi:MAG: SseB family protein [Actinobacteria bacterium]|nr:SseB family protein [Actinomycetota bacterium]